MKEPAEGRSKDGGVGRAQRHGEVDALQVGMGTSVPQYKRHEGVLEGGCHILLLV